MVKTSGGSDFVLSDDGDQLVVIIAMITLENDMYVVEL